MGLAASQARFLAITARKADCEFRSMQIAQNKLSVTREMEQATQDYQNAINATKMVWDYDGEQSFMTDISYGFLMTPSYLNNFNPYLITNRGGQVIVDSKIAAAAKAAGIDPEKGGARNPVNMYTFLENLGVQGVISDTIKLDLEVQIGLHDGTDNAAIFTHAMDTRLARYNDNGTMNSMSGLLSDNEKNAFYSYVANKGITINGTVYKANNAQEMKEKIGNLKVDGINKYMKGMTVEDILKQFSLENKGGASGDKLVSINGINYVINGTNVKTGGNRILITRGGKPVTYSYSENAGYGAMPMSKNEYTDVGISGLIKKLNEKKINVTMEGERVSGTASGTNYLVNGASKSSISLSDILTSKVVLMATMRDGDHTYGDENTYDDSIHGDVSDYFKKGANAICQALYGKTMDDPNVPKAFVTAFNYVANMYGIAPDKLSRSTIATIGTGSKGVGDAQTAAKQGADKLNKIVYYQNDGGKNNSVAAVNLSNLFGYFLTMYDNIASGWDTNYTLDSNPANCFFVTQDSKFRFAVLSEETVTNENVMRADFYMQLFNNLCVNGYVKNDEVKDNKYLEQMLKNGVYYMCGVNDQDGYFYQARYNDDVRTLIKVVNDEDAKTRAETEYSYKKMRLTAKEDRLDLEMKNIDMEIASLTSEYDSVKNLISKSVEKTFKQFES